MAMKAQEAVKEYRSSGWSDTWMAEIPMSECAYADAHGKRVGSGCHLDCTENAELMQEVKSRSVGRHSGRVALSDSMRRGKELLAFGLRRFDNTQALSDEEKRQTLSSDPRHSWH